MKLLSKKTRIITVLILFSILTYGQNVKKDTVDILTQNSDSYVENEFIIWLEPGVDAAEFAVNSNEGIVPKRLLSKRLNIWLFEITDGVEQRGMKMSNLSNNVNIKHIQNNHTNITLRSITPNDPFYSQQWAPAKISLPQAWDEFTTGGFTSTGDTIVVAVIDDGFFLNHVDLSFWKNIHEIPNNGIDDDNNGYIDDYDGWNAYNNNGVITSASHGTHVAGIIGAIGNNNIGVCGVNWNVGIMPIRGSSNNEAIVVAAYSYVLEMRATYNETNGQRGAFVVVTNSSFGVDYGNPNNYPIWCSMYDALGSVGILSCAAGPNLNVNIDVVGDVPATCPSDFLIGVTNTTSADIKNPGAGYGVNNIDIGAPGTNIYSTTPNNSYGNSTGTSMATPQVAGVIALMYAAMPENMIQAYKSDPANFALLVKQYLLDGADSLPSLNGLVASSRRLNAYGAIYTALRNNIVVMLEGTIGISGSAVFGQTLTVDTTDLTSTPTIPDLGELSYQWRRNTTNINGATNPTYTLVEADIDQVINVQVTAANCIGTVTSPNTDIVTKATQTAPDVPTLESSTTTSIILVTVSDCEYNINGGVWQSSSIFEELAPNTLYTFTQRKVETETHLASPKSPEAQFATDPLNIDENLSSRISIYPNPTTGELRIESGELRVRSVEVFDVYGRNVGINTSICSENWRDENVINISHLSAGVYFLKLSTELGEVVKQILKE
ncbi:MAG: S8 family peptidase [Chitinophagaceae bacterium]|jgi:subtilisin family serine protease|nr:S8 family peptidase [Chitinophagaceae bacterium]